MTTLLIDRRQALSRQQSADRYRVVSELLDDPRERTVDELRQQVEASSRRAIHADFTGTIERARQLANLQTRQALTYTDDDLCPQDEKACLWFGTWWFTGILAVMVGIAVGCRIAGWI